MFPSGDDHRTWDFFELGNFLKLNDPPLKWNLGNVKTWEHFIRNDPLQNLENNFKKGTFEKKSIIICKISVLFAIFKAKKYKLFCLRVLMRWK